MKSLTRGHLKAGLDSVRGAKWRNFWTMLGIIIGVASVITVFGIGEGIKMQVNDQIQHIGKNVITIQPSGFRANGSSGTSSLNILSGLSVSGTLSSHDVSTVKSTPGVGTTVPLSVASERVSADHDTASKQLVIGTTTGLSSVLNQSLAYGTFLNSGGGTNMNMVVLGSNTVSNLFNEDVPLGRSLMIDGQQFIVQGIFNSFPDTPLSQNANFNNAVFIPYSAEQALTKNSAPTYEILARATNSAQTKTVANQISQNLLSAHGEQNNFTVTRENQNITNDSAILDLLTRWIAGIAAVSLLVGGIGIMNVMLVSVTERMHEIGIRKALGATNRQILSQFIIEATILSLSGGLIGIALAFMIDLALHLLTNLQPAISWQIVVIAAGVSLLVGIVFGSIPALQAARKDPIEALRSD